MKSYLAKTGEIERKHILFDADGVPLGRMAVKDSQRAKRKRQADVYSSH